MNTVRDVVIEVLLLMFLNKSDNNLSLFVVGEFL